MCIRAEADCAGSSRAVLIGCLEMKFKTEREGARQKILTPLGDRRGGSVQHQREGGLSCSPWWAERLEAAWNSGVFLPPVNKPRKKKQKPKKNQTAPPHREGDGTARQEGRADRCQPRVITVTEATERRAAADERRLREKRTSARHCCLRLSGPPVWTGDFWTRASYFDHRGICYPPTIIVRRSRCGRSSRRRIGDTIVWSPEKHYLGKPSRENERRCPEFGWQKYSGRRWNWMSLTGCEPIWSTLQYFLSAGEERGGRGWESRWGLICPGLLAQV